MATGDIYYGVDIGTGNCSIAWVVDSARMRQQPLVPVEVVQFEGPRHDQKRPRFPSIALVPSTQRSKAKAIFGWPALRKRRASYQPGKNLFCSVKSDMGTRMVYDESIAPGLTTPVQVTAAILADMIGLVVRSGLRDPRGTRTVITVPASFAANQRQDTLDAAREAGLSVEDGDLLDEPVAALLDLCNSPELDARILPNEPRNLLVFDFGAGTCDVAVLRVQYANEGNPLGLRVETLGIGPYERFGGDNLDWAVMEHVVWPQVCARHGMAGEGHADELKNLFVRTNLWRVGRDLKERICERISESPESGAVRSRADLSVSGRTEGVELDGVIVPATAVSMTQRQFEQAIAPFIATDTRWSLFGDDLVESSLLQPVAETLEQAELEPGEIDYVVLNGGSCRNPYVRKCLEQWGHFAGAQIISVPDLDTSVARGAALHCFWRHARGQTLVPPIANEEIGVLTREQAFVPVLASGTRLPYPAGEGMAVVDATFSVPADSLEELAVPIYAGQGHRRRIVGTGHVPLGRAVPEGTPVQIEVRVDANRIARWRFEVLSETTLEDELTVANPWVNRVTRPEERELEAVSVRMSETFSRTGKVPLDLKVAQAAALYSAGNYLKAKEVIRAVLRHDPSNASAHGWLGLIYSQLGMHEESLASHQRAVQLGPEEPMHIGNCGVKLVQLGRDAEGIAKLQDAIASNPDLQYCHTWLGHAYRHLGDEERALKEFRRSAQVLARRISDSARPRAEDYRDLAYLQRTVGDYDEADRCEARAQEMRQQDLIGADPSAVVSSLDLLDLLGEGSE